MIYVVEDDANIRKLVCYSLKRGGFEAEGFYAPSELFAALKNKIPSLILLDIMLPETDGITVLEMLKKNSDYADIPVIMLTAKGSEFDKVTGLDAGADDYIVKPFGIPELISRINAVLRRYEKTKNTAVFDVGELHADMNRHEVKVSGKETELSFKEFELLRVLLEAKGNVVKRDTLLTEVWGEFYEESRTLDVHIRKLRVKLGAAGEYIQTVKNVGYKLEQ